MRRYLITLCALGATLAAAACADTATSADEAMADDAKAADTEAEMTADGEEQMDEKQVLYALGLMMAENLKSFGLSEDEIPSIVGGFEDGVKGDGKVDLRDYVPQIQALAKERGEKIAAMETEASIAFLAEKEQEDGFEKTESGLLYKELVAGTGTSPSATDQVKVHYHGTLRDGKVFDSSVERGQPASFALNQVIKCWTEGLQKMKPGGKSILVCPSEIAYADRAAGQIPPNAVLEFEVELLEVMQ